MATIYDGHGTTVTMGGVTIPAISIKLPGWSKSFYEISKLTNTTYKTKRAGALAEVGDITVTSEYSVGLAASLKALGPDITCVIVNTQGTATFYGAVASVGEASLEEDARSTFDVTFTVTNWNGTAETNPTFI
jgi:hypothetical protein